ncbi:MAG: hypothetical protein WD875_01765 [Pirellulales bacterium]
MDSPIIWQALLGLFAITAITFCVLGAQVWRVPTVLTVVGLFLGAATFFVLAAMTLKAHATWRTVYNAKQKEIAEAEKEHQKLIDGDSDAATNDAGAFDEETGEPIADAIAADASLLQMGNRKLRKELAAVREDRGKTWMGTGTLALPNADVTIVTPGATQIVKDMPIYVFEQKDDGAFLGEFKVTEVNGDAIKLALTETLAPEQMKSLAGKDGEWILRGIMPVDSHAAFQGLPKEELTKLIPQAATGLDAAAYAALIEEYVRDGQPAKPTTDPPDRIFKTVRMTKETEIEFTNDQGEKITQKLQSDDKLQVSSDKAQELVSQYGAEIVDATGIYLRPLRNYENTRRTLNLRMFELADRSVQVLAQTAVVEADIADAKGVRMDSLTKQEMGLTADKAKMNRDLDVIKKYLDDLNAQHVQLLADVQKHFAENNRLADELTKLQVDLAKKIDAQAANRGGASVVPVAR